MTTPTKNPKTPMPTWLQQQLISDGVMTEGFLTRTAKPRRCTTCHAPTLAAINDLGLDTHTDPQPLTPLGELQAHITGRDTYAHDMGALDTRDAPFITFLPAGGATPIYATHVCGAPPLDSLPPPPTPTAATTDCPY